MPNKTDNPKKTPAQQKAQARYMEKTARIEITMPKQKKLQLQEHAKARGDTVNRFINRAIDQAIERDTESEG